MLYGYANPAGQSGRNPQRCSLSARGARTDAERQLFADLKRTDVQDQRKPGGWSDEDRRPRRRRNERSGSCLVIVNTSVGTLHLRTVRQRNSRRHHGHLSTDMCPAHRKQELGKLRHRLGEKAAPPFVSARSSSKPVWMWDFGTVIRGLWQAWTPLPRRLAGATSQRRPSPASHLVNPADRRAWTSCQTSPHRREKTLRVLTSSSRTQIGSNPQPDRSPAPSNTSYFASSTERRTWLTRCSHDEVAQTDTCSICWQEKPAPSASTRGTTRQRRPSAFRQPS